MWSHPLTWLHAFACPSDRCVCGGDFHHSSAHHTFSHTSWILSELERWIHCGMTWRAKLDDRSHSSSIEDYTVTSTRVPDFLPAQRPMITTRESEEDGDEYGILEDERCAKDGPFQENFLLLIANTSLASPCPGQSRLVRLTSCPSWKLWAFDRQVRSPVSVSFFNGEHGLSDQFRCKRADFSFFELHKEWEASGRRGDTRWNNKQGAQTTRGAAIATMFRTARQSNLPHRTCGTQPWTTTKFLVSFESGDHLKKNDERGSSKVAGTLGEMQLSRTHSTGWRTKSSTTCMQWESLRGSSRSMPSGSRKEPAPRS